jgi:hypothetical protein
VTSLSDPAAPRKPRRLGLYIPWAIAVVLVIAWSLAWLWAAGEGQRRLDAGAAALRARGWQASWSRRQVSGYPFRFDVDFTDLRLADPSGWALALPSLKAEAYVFAPTNWIVAIPSRLTFTRPTSGPVNVGARRLRFSLNSWDQHPPRLSLEGEDMTFAAAPGAKPFFLAGAKDLQVYTRTGPADQGAILVTVTGGSATPGTWLATLAQGSPVAFATDAILSHASALRGHGWREALTNWAHGGGALAIRQLTLTGGGAGFDARSGQLSVGDDGRLVGALPATVTQPTRVLAALAGLKGERRLATSDPSQSVSLELKSGKVWIDGLRVAPAPRIF